MGSSESLLALLLALSAVRGAQGSCDSSWELSETVRLDKFPWYKVDVLGKDRGILLAFFCLFTL